MPEMERATVNRKLAIIDAVSRPDTGDAVAHWHQRWKRWDREVKQDMLWVGSSLNEAMCVASVRQRMPAELQWRLKLNAMAYGEHYDARHDLIEAFFGAGKDEALDDNYGGLEFGYVCAEYQRGGKDISEKKCFNCTPRIIAAARPAKRPPKATARVARERNRRARVTASPWARTRGR